MDDKDLGEFLVEFLTILAKVGRHVAAFQLAMNEKRYADARREFIRARTATVRLKLSLRISRRGRVMLNALRDEMFSIIREHGLNEFFRLIGWRKK